MNEEDKNKLPAPGDVAGQIKKYCRLWEKDGHEERDKFLRKLFPGARLSNDGKDNTLKDTDKILIQICALDTFYGTGTPSEFLIPLAKQILDLESDFKERVSRGCPVLVADIAEKVVAKVKAKDGKDKTRRNNSLATKYCSFITRINIRYMIVMSGKCSWHSIRNQDMNVFMVLANFANLQMRWLPILRQSGLPRITKSTVG